MTYPPSGPAGDLVDTILAATPSWFFDQQLPATIGAVMVGHDDNGPIFGDPRPVAARQAAAARPAVYRELADMLDAKADAVSTNPRYRPRLFLDAPRLRELADQLDKETP